MITSDNCWYKKSCNMNPCDEHCIRLLEMRYLMNHSGLPENKQRPIPLTPVNADIDAFDRLVDIKNNIVEFVNSGNNLYLTSKYCGNGKTSWSIKLLLKYFDEVWAGNGFRTRGVFLHIPTFFMRMKNNISDRDEEFLQLRDSIMNADLVVWDEIANTGLTKYEYEQLLAYIDYRLLSGKSNIYTSNITDIEDVQKMLGIKLASRVYNSSEIIEFNGKDRRSGTTTIYQ